MKKTSITLLLFLMLSAAFAQEKYLDRKAIDSRTDSIMAEGKALYKSERASWYGTDIFLEKFKDKRALIGGYLSYETKTGAKNIFFGKGDDPKVLASISFTNDFNEKNYTLDTTGRKLNAAEKDIYTIRRIALERLRQDTIFKFYQNTDINVVPLIRGGHKRVYVLTAPKANGVVIYGNDYLIDFDKANQIRSVTPVHNSLISASAGDNSDTSKIVLEFIHSHILGKEPFMTATDICTTMLYHHLTTWKQALVISKNYVSIWDSNKNSMFVLTIDAWKRIARDQSGKKSRE